MIQEQYVSFDTAKLLKEKGFDVTIQKHYYSSTGRESEVDTIYKNWNEDSSFVSEPSQSLSMRWLREVHNLFIAFYNDDLNYCWCVLDLDDRDENLDPKQITSSYGGYLTYEQGCEAAIKYCLENLI